MKPVLGLMLALGWAHVGGATPRDLPTAGAVVVRVFETQTHVVPGEVLAYLPGGRVLASAPQGAKSLAGGPWTLESAMTPTLRKALVGASAYRLVPIVVGVAPGVSLTEVSDVLEARGGAVAWHDVSGAVWKIGLKVSAPDLANVVGGLSAFDGLVVFADVQPGGKAAKQSLRSAVPGWWGCRHAAVRSRPPGPGADHRPDGHRDRCRQLLFRGPRFRTAGDKRLARHRCRSRAPKDFGSRFLVGR